jgi:hypothetical protein
MTGTVFPTAPRSDTMLAARTVWERDSYDGQLDASLGTLPVEHGSHRSVLAGAHLLPTLGVGPHQIVDRLVEGVYGLAAVHAHDLTILLGYLELDLYAVATITAVELHHLVTAAVVVLDPLFHQILCQNGVLVPSLACLRGPLCRHKNRRRLRQPARQQ